MKRTACAVLAFVALAWGVGMPIWQVSARILSPATAMCLRYASSAVLVYLLIRGRVGERRALAWGVPLGMLNQTTNFTLASSLTTIASPRCAFFIGTTVALIPALLVLTRQGRPRRIEWMAATTSLLGLALITGFRPSSLSNGDFWALGSALSGSTGILLMGRLGDERGLNLGAVLFWEYVVTALLSLPLMLDQPPLTRDMIVRAAPTLIYSVVVASVVAQGLQMRFQAHAGATNAALIFALRPVFTCCTAVLFMDEHIDRATITGGGLMFFASIVPHVVDALPIHPDTRDAA